MSDQSSIRKRGRYIQCDLYGTPWIINQYVPSFSPNFPRRLFLKESFIEHYNKRQNELYSEVSKLFSHCSTDVLALLPSAMLQIQARGTCKNSLQNLLHSSFYLLVYLLRDIREQISLMSKTCVYASHLQIWANKSAIGCMENT